MVQKEKRQKTADELQAERITAALEETDRTGRAPACVKENPGQFLRDMYEVWHRQGGKEGGRPRNSIRKMRDDWLVGRHHVPSLHPKLMGRVKVTRSDARALVELFLKRWRVAEGSDALSAMTEDGYVGFPATDRTKLRDGLLRALVRPNDPGAGIDLPRQRREQESVEETRRRWVNVEQVMHDADALITLSRHRIAVGTNSIETMSNFWHTLNHLYRSSQDRIDKQILIWVVDIGSRLVEQKFAFDEFFNAGLLALQIQSFAKFDSLNDYDENDRSRFFPRLQITEGVHRDDRWHWLSERTVVVVQNLRIEEFDGLYDDQHTMLGNIRLKDIGVTAEHILPNKTPGEWAKQLRSLYGRNIEAADATFTVFYSYKDKERISSGQDLRYFAHTLTSSDRNLFDEPLPNVALSTRSTELQSPGQNYDDAFRLLYWASRFRLDMADKTEHREGLTALAYLRKHGFRCLLLRDFIRIFSI